MIPDNNYPCQRLNLAQGSDYLVLKRIFMKAYQAEVLITRMYLK